MTKKKRRKPAPLVCGRVCVSRAAHFLLSRQIRAEGVGALAAAEDTQCSFLTYFIVSRIKVPQSQAHDGSVFVESVWRLPVIPNRADSA